MIRSIFDPHYWAIVPFQFWAVVFFIFGSMVGSFLNVCIHRLPLGQSIVSPPSHCPHCHYSIPWFLNIPLVTWVYLGGKCRNCGAPIAIRYFLVELLTGLLFFGCWELYGQRSAPLVLVYCVVLAGLIVATFIDFEHYIIPDEITIGGMVVGFLASFLVPAPHERHGASPSVTEAMKQSLLGLAAGAGLIYAILRLGKLAFGRKRRALPEPTRIIFTETALILPGEEILYGDLLYRKSDVIRLQASTLELVDRCYKDVAVALSADRLQIGQDTFNPENVLHMEAVSSEIVLPQEAMGLGDVKFMGAIGAFLGWQGVLFSLMASSVIGSVVGLTLIALRKRAWSARLPYGPYIAAAAALWIFGGKKFVENWLGW
jgi:leader peptidase (prepilin peptidase) / N-methyltransferase